MAGNMPTSAWQMESRSKPNLALPCVRDPKDYMNTRILHSASQSKIAETMVFAGSLSLCDLLELLCVAGMVL